MIQKNKPGNKEIAKIVQGALSLHQWNISPSEAIKIQKSLALRVETTDSPVLNHLKKLVAFDVSAKKHSKNLYAAAVLWNMEKQKAQDVIKVKTKATFPYVPGLLSFREMVVMLEAFSRLKELPQLLLCDAQGMAHPRLFGLACHIGVATGIPSIGCAKSLLTGVHGKVGTAKGAYSPIMIDKKKVGYALRSRENAKPIYVSPGHRVSFMRAVEIILSLTSKFRIPDPLRIAHSESIAYMKKNEY